MLRAVEELKGSAIAASDGEIGKVVDFYFDDEKWTVRYLVADTGGWLTGRQVLISPVSISKLEWYAHKIDVDLTKEQVEKSPGIDEDRPVSRQHEADYFAYYNYPYYWTGPYIWGPAPLPRQAPTSPPAETQSREALEMIHAGDDVHLRSVGEVIGYDIGAKDGPVGHVENLVVDDQSWTIRYIIVDTRNWLPGKKVLVSPEWISSISWPESRVQVDLSRDAIKSCPEYDPYKPIERAYEERVYRHYGRPNYWVP